VRRSCDASARYATDRAGKATKGRLETGCVQKKRGYRTPVVTGEADAQFVNRRLTILYIVQIHGRGTELFLYLNGLAIDQPVALGADIDLLPAHPDCNAELFLGLGKSDADISVISLFLPPVRSQLRVRGRDQKDAAIRAWNASWHWILLGALQLSEVICNLQSDQPVEELTPGSTVIVTNYHLRGFSKIAPPPLSNADAAWAGQYFMQALRLMEIDTFRNAVHCLSSHRWHPLPRARLALLWSGIEGLFGVDSELVFRISLYTARFLAADDSAGRKTLFEKVKELYKLRSKAVHGGTVKGDPNESVRETERLLRSLLLKCIETGALPNVVELVP
jgi:hypothetical protein